MKLRAALTLTALSFSGLLLGAPQALAQSTDDHFGPASESTKLSTPAERAETQNLNATVAQNNEAADAQAAANNAQADANNAQYQAQVAQYEMALRDYSAVVDRYRAERAGYRRVVWEPRYTDWVLVSDEGLMDARVQILNGDRIGKVSAIARAKNSPHRIEAVCVTLDNGDNVWIDRDDLRFNRSGRVLVTRLERGDIVLMARERL